MRTLFRAVSSPLQFPNGKRNVKMSHQTRPITDLTANLAINQLIYLSQLTNLEPRLVIVSNFLNHNVAFRLISTCQ